MYDYIWLTEISLVPEASDYIRLTEISLVPEAYDYIRPTVAYDDLASISGDYILLINSLTILSLLYLSLLKSVKMSSIVLPWQR